MMEELQREVLKICPVCKGKEFNNVLTCEDYTYSQEHFDIQKCILCNFHFTNPRPDAKCIHNFYGSPDYISHTGKTQNILDSIYLGVRTLTLRWKYRLISRKKKEGSLLDYGCGSGEFLAYMDKRGWKVFGMEPSALARDRANQLLGAERRLVEEKLEDIEHKKLDVITLWHVLEHVPDPNKLLTDLKLLLADDGLIYIAVPNFESFDAQYYGKYWAGYDVPRHFWHFSHSTLQRLLSNRGFAIREKIPMKLDAFYVSLLSEKYKNKGKHSSTVLIKAFATGFISNLKANRNMNYSSHIYIVHHQ